MSKYYENSDAVIYQGNCLDELKNLEDNSIDAVVTDPPYELGFMGKKWDSTGIAYNVEVWKECLRVLKPGGHLLAFGGSRTWHRLAVAVEDAGFDIRDSIAWIYGSGFPKSLNVSKAVDDLRAKQSANGLLPEEKLFCDWMKEYSGFTEAKCKELLGSARFITGEVEIVNTATKENPRMGRRAMVPTSAAWEKIKPLLANTPPDWVEELVKEPPKPGITHPGDWKSGKGEGTTGENEWAGWGTALKPAIEPIVVARKPLIGTVAENVLEYGVGGINIDASRIGNETISVHNAPKGTFAGGEYDRGSDTDSYREHTGRWPANVIFGHTEDCVEVGVVTDTYSINKTEEWTGFGQKERPDYTGEEKKVSTPLYECVDWCPVKELDEQSGVSKSRAGKMAIPDIRSGKYGSEYGSREDVDGTVRGFNDSGGASRFFYVAKANKKDRNEGLDSLPDHDWSGDGAAIPERANRPFIPSKNHHPTVKPTSLMTYLIKLVTPKGGVVLDPFTGSGSTGKAAIRSGYKFVGIELTEEYLPIIATRLDYEIKQKVEDLFSE